MEATDLKPNPDPTPRAARPASPARRTARPGEAAAATGTDAEVRVPVVEEQLDVRKREVETGRVAVRVKPVEQEQVVAATLASHDVDVQRVPAEREVDSPPPVRQEGDVTIVPVMEERLVVTKKLFVTYELHIRRRSTSREVRQPVTVRRV
jgi:stress response protein YsnF